jgi:hypothetical protein
MFAPQMGLALALALPAILLRAGLANADSSASASTSASSPASASASSPASAPALDPIVPYPPETPRVLTPPARAYTFAEPQPYPSLAWLGLQLLPSPEVAAGRVETCLARAPTGACLDPSGRPIVGEKETRTAFGLRWQLTPVVWSWGVNRRVSRWRLFVVDPLARHSGSLELSTSFEYIFGHVDRAIVRPGVRAYFPLAQRGEYLSASLGTSTYSYDSKMHVAYDVGAYVLFGIFGVQLTVAPNHDPLMAIGTFRIRYF